MPNKKAKAENDQDRREFLKAAGVVGVTALLGSTAAFAGASPPQRRGTRDVLTHDNLAKFAGLVAKVWNDPNLQRDYHNNATKVLAAHGIRLPRGVPTPVIPPRPQGAGTPELGRAWKDLNFENWDLAVSHVEGGGGVLGISISSLACAACPVSSFSSLSN